MLCFAAVRCCYTLQFPAFYILSLYRMARFRSLKQISNTATINR